MNYTSRKVFLNDLNTGRKYENQILQNIKLKYPCSFLIDKHFKDYDIFIPETNVKIEVKCDFRSRDTGNIVIELFMFNKHLKENLINQTLNSPLRTMLISLILSMVNSFEVNTCCCFFYSLYLQFSVYHYHKACWSFKE